MKIYSDTLTLSDLHNTVCQVGGIYLDSIESIDRPRVRQNGWIVQTSGSGNRWKNTGTMGASQEKAASFDQHGRWFARLYELDPSARIAIYQGDEDFHEKTQGRYSAAVLCAPSPPY